MGVLYVSKVGGRQMVRAGQILLAKLPPLGLYVNTTATFQDILAIINFALASGQPPTLTEVW